MIEALKQKLAEEAEKLRYELNVTLPGEIRRAVEMGDLRENSEYKAALERQRLVQARLGQLAQRLSKLSQIDVTQIPRDRDLGQLAQRLSKLSQIDVTQIPRDRVGLGSRIEVEDQDSKVRETYHLVFGD